MVDYIVKHKSLQFDVFSVQYRYCNFTCTRYSGTRGTISSTCFPPVLYRLCMAVACRSVGTGALPAWLGPSNSWFFWPTLDQGGASWPVSSNRLCGWWWCSGSGWCASWTSLSAMASSSRSMAASGLRVLRRSKSRVDRSSGFRSSIATGFQRWIMHMQTRQLSLGSGWNRSRKNCDTYVLSFQKLLRCMATLKISLVSTDLSTVHVQCFSPLLESQNDVSVPPLSFKGGRAIKRDDFSSGIQNVSHVTISHDLARNICNHPVQILAGGRRKVPWWQIWHWSTGGTSFTSPESCLLQLRPKHTFLDSLGCPCPTSALSSLNSGRHLEKPVL